MKRFFIGIFLLVLFLSFFIMVKADELDDINNAINSLKKDLSSKEADYQSLNTRLNEIKSKLNNLEQAINQKEIEVKKGEQVLTYQKELLNERAKSYYKNVNKNSTLFLSVLVADDLSVSLRKIFYQKSLVDEDKRTIIKIVLYIKNLEEIKKNLEIEKLGLARLKLEVDKQSQIIAGQISQTKTQIAQLSARQQELIAAKLASVPVPRSAETSLKGCKSDIDVDPGFGSRFAFFSFGVPNKIGLNQYGAKERAATQGHEDILRAYYNDISFETRPNINIKVQGYGEIPIETYLLGIYEMPESWPIEALKAQAIAARSYALAYTNNGAGEICTTESCQVYRQPEKTGQWRTAVQETVGKTIIQGGQPIKAWFSSTHGGVILASSEIGWSGTSWTKHSIDTPSGSSGSFSELQSNSYDRSSPWFYCDWGYREQYNNTAWLKMEEVTDIVNAFILYTHDKNTIIHLSQTDKNTPDTWSAERVKEELKKYETPINSIDSINVSWDSSGISRTIVINGRSFDAQKFKNLFNMKAPANIQIKPACNPSVELDCNSYALFNIEKR